VSCYTRSHSCRSSSEWRTDGITGSTIPISFWQRRLLDYATVRLERCRFGEAKPTCAKCPVHCYQPARREQVKRVMRYADPAMVLEHRVLALGHWLDGCRQAPL
jgi:hypothetical protein